MIIRADARHDTTKTILDHGISAAYFGKDDLAMEDTT
jgi:hypothetical protein